MQAGRCGSMILERSTLAYFHNHLPPFYFQSLRFYKKKTTDGGGRGEGDPDPLDPLNQPRQDSLKVQNEMKQI